MEQAIFAAGCFWGGQYYFDQVPGVVETEVGYTGGKIKNPTYEEVCAQTTGHAEAVRVTFDPHKISYETLVRHFFRLHDPTQLNRQGPDVGSNYRSAIFFMNEAQQDTAAMVLMREQKGQRKKIVTQLELVGPFYRAEKYHQKYTERTGRGMCDVPYAPL